MIYLPWTPQCEKNTVILSEPQQQLVLHLLPCTDNLSRKWQLMSAHVKRVQCWQLIFLYQLSFIIILTKINKRFKCKTISIVQKLMRSGYPESNQMVTGWQDWTKDVFWYMVYLGSTLGGWHFHLEKDSVQTRVKWDVMFQIYAEKFQYKFSLILKSVKWHLTLAPISVNLNLPLISD